MDHGFNEEVQHLMKLSGMGLFSFQHLIYSWNRPSIQNYFSETKRSHEEGIVEREWRHWNSCLVKGQAYGPIGGYSRTLDENIA